MVIGLSFDLAGYLLMALPYTLFWDYDDNNAISVLKQSEKEGKEAAAVAEAKADAEEALQSE